MSTFFRAERRWPLLAGSLAGALAVALTLAINVTRGYPIASLVVALLIAGALRWFWVRAGRPRGVVEAEALAEVASDPREH
jgi:hypothetical protein